MSTQEQESQAEIERLRARIVELEVELAEVSLWANRAVAEAQAKTYWLDRWQVDLNALMRRRSARWLRAAASGVRSVNRAAGRCGRRYRK